MLVERRRQEQRDVGMALHDSAVLPRSLDCRLLERALDDLVRGVIVRNYVWSWWKSVGSVHVASSCISSTGQASTSSGPRSTSPDICTTILNYCLTSYLASLPPAMPSPSYVTSSASPLLPETIECTLRYTIHALATRLSNVDPEYLVVERIVPLIIRHVREYKRALAVVNQSGRRHLSRTAEDGERMVVEAFRARATASATAKISTTGGIASSLDTTASELAHLRTIATTRILPALLPPTLLNSPTIRMLLREILVACILHPILTMLRDPDYWNQTMDMYATRAVSELRMVRKVREALERPFHEQAGAHGDAHGGGLPFMNVDEDSSQIFGNSAKVWLLL